MALRSLATFAAVAALVGLTSLKAVWADEKLSWLGWSGEGAASLAYGLAESDHVLLSLACEKAGTPIRLVYPHEPAQPVDGGTYELTLKTEKQALSLKTTGTRLEMDDLFILEGELPKGTDLVALLTAGKTLTVAVDQDVTELPLDGAASAGSALFEICGR